MESNKNQRIKLKSYDGHVLECNYDAIILNRFLYDMFEGAEVGDEAIEIPNEFLKKDNLQKVIEYCDFAYKNHPPKIQKPIRQSNIYDITSPFYAKYASEFDENTLCEMILAANFLNNDGLLQLLSAKLACDLKEKTVEEFRLYFSIQNDWTEDDIKRLDEQKEEAIEIFDLE